MLIPISKENYVTKSEALLKARYHLGELALKLISIIYSNVKRSDEVGKFYEIKVIDIANLMNKNYGEMYNLLKDATDELLSSPVRIEDKEKKEWVAFNWISDAQYRDGVISFSISQRLKPFVLDLKQKFLKYKLENILSLRGTYVIRLYEILKDKFNEQKRYNKKCEFILSVKELKEMLEIPKSYQYSSHIKLRILKKAKKQFAIHTDITFNFEEIKTGRKVTHIKFIIKENSKTEKNSKKENSKNTEPAKLNIRGKEENSIDEFKQFRHEIITKVDENKVILLDDNVYKIKDNLLYLDNRLLNNTEALEHWKKLYENRDKITIKDKEKFEKKKKESEIDKLKTELLKIYFGKTYEIITKNALGGYETLKYEILDIDDIVFKDNSEIDYIVLIGEGEDRMRYKITATLNQLKLNVK
jgi:plasmid replication initiation protein